MAEAAHRILFVGDIHLGRRPWSPALEALGLRANQLGPARAFQNTVKLAIETAVDAVVLAGDVIESEKDRFEAYRHLEQGTERLLEAGIAVFGVAGNHDAIALPRLASRIEGFDLIGAKGEWETRTLSIPTKGTLRLLGWSFTRSHHESNPFHHPSWAKIRPTLEPSKEPLLGVLHCDLDASSSRYAPVKKSDLESSGADAFFLGHVHQPSDLKTERPIGYLGSLVGLDAGEPGPRGPWLVSVRGRGQVEATQRSVGPLRWERMVVPVDGLEGPEAEDELHQRILAGFDEHARTALTGLDGSIKAVGCRVELHGETSARTAIDRYVAESASREITRQVDGTVYFLEKLLDQSAPSLDLEKEAKGQSPLALLAKEILALEAGLGETSALVTDFTREVETLTARHWRSLPVTEPKPDPGQLLLRAARKLAKEMLGADPRRTAAETER